MKEQHSWMSFYGSPPEREFICTCGAFFAEMQGDAGWQYHHEHTLQHVNKECNCYG